MSKKGDLDILSVRNSRKIYIPVYTMAAVLFIVLFVLYFKGYPITLLSIALVLIFAFFAIKMTEVHRLINKYEILYPSLVCTTGLFNKNSRRIDLLSISDADVIQTLWQRIWKYGDVRVRLFSSESTAIIRNINAPEKFVKFLEGKMLELRRGK